MLYTVEQVPKELKVSKTAIYNKLKLKEFKCKIVKKQEVSRRRAKIKDLLVEGLTQKEIYTSLNISKRTCINDVKLLK
ncbi:TPA: hypothetical protein ACF2DM_003036 [Clostridium perfringens]|nr:hypothetical protein [Paeniclostridium sp.]